MMPFELTFIAKNPGLKTSSEMLMFFPCVMLLPDVFIMSSRPVEPDVDFETVWGDTEESFTVFNEMKITEPVINAVTNTVNIILDFLSHI